MRAISHRVETFFCKFVIPAMPSAVCIWGLATDMPIGAAIVFFVLGTAGFLLWGWKLKHVSATDDGLLVRNYSGTVTVPYAQLETVRLEKTGRGNYLRITVHEPLPWGRVFHVLPTSNALDVLRERAPHATTAATPAPARVVSR